MVLIHSPSFGSDHRKYRFKPNIVVGALAVTFVCLLFFAGDASEPVTPALVGMEVGVKPNKPNPTVQQATEQGQAMLRAGTSAGQEGEPEQAKLLAGSSAAEPGSDPVQIKPHAGTSAGQETTPDQAKPQTDRTAGEEGDSVAKPLRRTRLLSSPADSKQAERLAKAHEKFNETRANRFEKRGLDSKVASDKVNAIKDKKNARRLDDGCDICAIDATEIANGVCDDPDGDFWNSPFFGYEGGDCCIETCINRGGGSCPDNNNNCLETQFESPVTCGGSDRTYLVPNAGFSSEPSNDWFFDKVTRVADAYSFCKPGSLQFDVTFGFYEYFDPDPAKNQVPFADIDHSFDTPIDVSGGVSLQLSAMVYLQGLLGGIFVGALVFLSDGSDRQLEFPFYNDEYEGAWVSGSDKIIIEPKTGLEMTGFYIGIEYDCFNEFGPDPDDPEFFVLEPEEAQALCTLAYLDDLGLSIAPLM